MSTTDFIEHFLLHGEISHEQVDATSWLLHLDCQTRHPVVLRVEDPICLVSAQIIPVAETTPDQGALFRKLLELNADMLHCSYVLQGNQVVLSGSQQLENINENEIQALLDDMTMALDNHRDALAPWKTQA